MWFSIVVFTAMGIPLVQIDDQRGPYENIQTCYIRCAEVIKDLNSGKFPIILAQAFCVDKSHSQKKPSVIDKPQKPKVPEDNV